jgi:hypothetical protein
VWRVTEIGKDRVNHFNKTKKDIDEGLAPLLGVEVSMSEENISPEEGFNRIENVA